MTGEGDRDAGLDAWALATGQILKELLTQQSEVEAALHAVHAEVASPPSTLGAADGVPAVGPLPSDYLTLTWENVDGHAVVSISGELDYNTSPTLESLLEDLRRHGYSHYVVVFAKASFLDSAGLNVLLRHWHTVGGQSGKMQIVTTQISIRKVLDLFGFSDAVHLSLDAALEAADES
ncbi:STAS domain-containing protein [Streptomyces sp. NPDC001663]|uniref:STAS domain-containing protein n=1 Tax=Streptomyces sp. NPDC001663 TaxID=3364597 RepID=UPI0036805E79